MQFGKILSEQKQKSTFMITSQDEGQLVCKQFQLNHGHQHQEDVNQIEEMMKQIQGKFELIKNPPNVLVLRLEKPDKYLEKVENQQIKFDASILFLVRQFVYQSLQVKMRNKIPKMSLAEKKWLIFQLLCAISQTHSVNLVHGDIKPENIMVTSYNHLILTDMVVYKPTFFLESDLMHYNLYYGEMDNNQRCYFAPERFKFKDDFNERGRDYSMLEREMDIFSAGCVIAEIMMDGSPLFDLPKLQRYRKGNYDPQADLLRISNKEITEVILKMIDADPSKRPGINECLQQLNDSFFPRAYSRVFFQLSSSFLRSQYLYSDMKISLLRKYIPSVWRCCLDSSMLPKDIHRKFREPIERLVFDKIRQDNMASLNEDLVPSNTLFEFLSFDNSDILNFDIKEQDKDSVIIFILWIGSFIGTCYYPQTRRCALELLLNIAKESSLEIRLQYILPYVFKMFEDKQSKVLAKAIEVSVLMFENVIQADTSCILTSTDYKVFDNYIMPHFHKVQKAHKDDPLVQITYTKYIPLLAKIGQRFTELSITSRMARRSHHQQAHQGQEEADQEERLSSSIIIEDEEEDQSADILSALQSNLLQRVKQALPPESAGSFNDPEEEKKEQIPAEAPKQAEAERETGVVHHTHQDVFVNYDKEIESLRKKFDSLIKDSSVSNDINVVRILFANLGTLCDFFGTKVTMDNLIPIVIACFNKKEFLVKMDCIKSITGISMKVGKQTLSQYLLQISLQFLYDSEELVVLQILKTLNELLKLRLIPKTSLVDLKPYTAALHNQEKPPADPNSVNLFEKLLPFLFHPNTWIREEAMTFILTLGDFKKLKVLTKAEVSCVICRTLRKYFKNAQSANEIIYGSPKASELVKLLRDPLSRQVFDMYVKVDPKRIEDLQHMKATKDDQFALGVLKDVIDHTHNKYLFDSQQSLDQKASKQNFLARRDKIYNQYRVIRLQTLQDLAKSQENQRLEFKNLKRELTEAKKTDSFTNQFFEPCKRIKSDQSFNMNNGLNTRDEKQVQSMSEIDVIMQALSLLPEEADIPLVEYKDKQLFTRVANQSLPEGWRLQVEKLGAQVGSPSELPQFNYLYSRTTSLAVNNSKNPGFTRSVMICEPKTATQNFRPKGRLITTLYEHKHPVNSVTVTEDQSLFFTSSKQDGMVLGWDTKDVERDATSRSSLRFKSKNQVNQVCTLHNASYLCVAGSESNLDVYDIQRLESLKSEDADEARVVALDHKNEGEMMNITNTMLPLSHQHMLLYSSQRGSLFMHDLRCRNPALKQTEAFLQKRGMLTCMTQGQDPYQIFCGSIGGYVMVYDIRFNMVSSSFKHNQKHPITSIATFKPQDQSFYYNRSTAQNPLALVASGGTSYELALLNLDTGHTEYIMQVNEAQGKDPAMQGPLQTHTVTVPSFYRESLIRDCFNWPEKSETNQSLFRRYLMQTRSLVGSQQIKLTQNIDDELFKSSKNLYKLVKEANESINGCRKVLIPRKYPNLLQGTHTAEYALTGGNDMRIRYWDMNNLASKSYYVNTPEDDECQYHTETIAGGIQMVSEQISKNKKFPPINVDMLPAVNSGARGIIRQVPNSIIEMKGDSVYYQILQDMILQNNTEDLDLTQLSNAQAYLKQSSLNDPMSGVAHQYQIGLGRVKENQRERSVVMVYNYNGLSEWQHLNGFCGNQGNSTLFNSSYKDMYGASQSQVNRSGSIKSAKKDSDSMINQPYRNKSISGDQRDLMDENNEYLFRESQNVSHSDAILDMAIVEVDSQGAGYGASEAAYSTIQTYLDSAANASAQPLLITCSRDCTVKLWK